MGFRSISEIVGRTDLVTVEPDERYPGSRRMKLTPLLLPRLMAVLAWDREKGTTTRRRPLMDWLTSELTAFIERGEPVAREYGIRNTDRSVPVRLSYYVAKYHRERRDFLTIQ